MPLHRRGELAIHGAGEQPGQVAAQHLAVQGVGEPHVGATAFLGDRDPAVALEVHQRAGVREAFEEAETDRLAEGDDGEGVATGGVEPVEPAGDEVDELRRRGHGVELGRGARLVHRPRERRHEQRVAAGEADEVVGGVGREVGVEERVGHRDRLGRAELSDRPAFDVSVAPQLADRFRHPFAVVGGGDDDHRAGRDELVHERRRRRVEEVHVVDTERQRTSATEVGDRGTGGHEQRDALVTLDLARQQRGEGGEGDIRDRAPAADEAGREPGRFGDADQFLGEAGHAAAGGPMEHEAPLPVGEQPLEAAHLSGAPQERSTCASGVVRHGVVALRVERFHVVSSMSESPGLLVTGWVMPRLTLWKVRM